MCPSQVLGTRTDVPSVKGKGGGKILLPRAQVWPYGKLWAAELLRIEVVSKWLVMDHKINQYLKKRTKGVFLLHLTRNWCRQSSLE